MRGQNTMVILGVTLYSGTALAAGYGLKEFSADAMGAAYAGAAATGSDPTYLAYNPASLAAVEHADIALSVIGIYPGSDASYPNATTAFATPAGGSSTPTEFVKNAAVPGFGARLRLSEDWAVGLAVGAPWGLSTEYSADWAGRYHAIGTKFLTVNMTPSVSYQLSPRLALAGGVQIQFANGTLSNAIDMGTIGAAFLVPGSVPGGQDGRGTFKADDWGYGFSLGAIAQLSDDITAGLSYRSSIKHVMNGQLTYNLDSAGVGAALNGATGIFTDTTAHTELTTPDVVSFGARVDLTDQWSGLFELDWTNWSKFQELRIVAANPAQPDDLTVTDWENAWFISVGAEYHPNGPWTFRTGVAYDQTPVPDATRNPRIPDADRIWLSAGVSYRASDQLEFKLSGAHLFLGAEPVNLTAAMPGNAFRGGLAGTTNAEANVVALQVVFRP